MDGSFFTSRRCLHGAIGVSISHNGLGLMEVSRFSALVHRRLRVVVFRSSPSSVTFFHASILLKRQSFDKHRQLL